MKRLLLSTLILVSMHSFAIDLTDIKQEKEYELYGASTNAQMEFNNAYKYRQFATYSGKYVVFQAAHPHNYGDKENEFGYFVKNTLDNSVTRLPAPTGVDDHVFSQTKVINMSANGRFMLLSAHPLKSPENSQTSAYLLYLYDLKSGNIELITKKESGEPIDTHSIGFKGGVSEDGQFIYFGYYGRSIEDDASTHNLYLWEASNKSFTRINIDINGKPASTTNEFNQRAMSGDGHYLIYQTSDEMLSGYKGTGLIYIYDRITKTNRLISKDLTTNKVRTNTSFPSLSIDGKYIAFRSDRHFIPEIDESNDAGGTRVVWFNLETLEQKYVNKDNDGHYLGERCQKISISEGGKSVAFLCNDQAYFYDNTENKIYRPATSTIDGEQHGAIVNPRVLDDGSGFLWKSNSAHLLPNEPTSNPDQQLYLYRQKPGTTESKICFSDEY